LEFEIPFRSSGLYQSAESNIIRADISQPSHVIERRLTQSKLNRLITDPIKTVQTFAKAWTLSV